MSFGPAHVHHRSYGLVHRAVSYDDFEDEMTTQGTWHDAVPVARAQWHLTLGTFLKIHFY